MGPRTRTIYASEWKIYLYDWLKCLLCAARILMERPWLVYASPNRRAVMSPMYASSSS